MCYTKQQSREFKVLLLIQEHREILLLETTKTPNDR